MPVDFHGVFSNSRDIVWTISASTFNRMASWNAFIPTGTKPKIATRAKPTMPRAIVNSIRLNPPRLPFILMHGFNFFAFRCFS